MDDLPEADRKTPEDWLRWLGKYARGFADPVMIDDAGDACLWALAEIESLRARIRDCYCDGNMRDGKEVGGDDKRYPWSGNDAG